ncbi:MAG: 4Fe-4S binding protein [Deltaproteobacteria bacterium]|nr:4Fe-4S binding protein [Deltaproteobacteria bacterium]
MSDKVCQLPVAHSLETIEANKSPSLEQAEKLATVCLATLDCTYCEVCELLCPDQCITRHPETGHILIDLNHCKGCGLCAVYCPKGAIQMELEKG